MRTLCLRTRVTATTTTSATGALATAQKHGRQLEGAHTRQFRIHEVGALSPSPMATPTLLQSTESGSQALSLSLPACRPPDACFATPPSLETSAPARSRPPKRNRHDRGDLTNAPPRMRLRAAPALLPCRDAPPGPLVACPAWRGLEIRAIRGRRRPRARRASSHRSGSRRMRTTAPAASLLLRPPGSEVGATREDATAAAQLGRPATGRSALVLAEAAEELAIVRLFDQGGCERPTRPGRNATHHRASTRPRLCRLGSPRRMDKALGSRARRESQAFRLGRRCQVW
jgi:hypothetical protein